MVFTYILYLFVCAHVCNLWELALFFHHGDLMAQTQVVRLRHAPLLSHLASIQIWYLLIDSL